jgi:hypothetical protein
VLVFHLSRCEVTDHAKVRCCGLSIGWNGGDGWNPSGDVVSHAQIC